MLTISDHLYTGWKHIITEDGVQVYRKFLDGPNSQYACVMCNGTVHAPPRNVLSLLEDPYRLAISLSLADIALCKFTTSFLVRNNLQIKLLISIGLTN